VEADFLVVYGEFEGEYETLARFYEHMRIELHSPFLKYDFVCLQIDKSKRPHTLFFIHSQGFP